MANQSVPGANDAETATQTLHRLTSYTPDQSWDQPADDPRIRQDFVANDVGRRPRPAKRYDSTLPRVPLPRELPTNPAPALAVLGGTAPVADGPLDLAGLARVLHWSAGVVRTREMPWGRFLFRAAGSAGARFPLELYVVVPDGGGHEVPAGVHWYDPVEHALVRIGAAPDGADGSAPTIVVTGVPWRTGWRYAERGFRHVYWDAGTMLAQLLGLAESAGYGPRLYSEFPDAAVAALVGVDRVAEWPVALVALGGGQPVTAGAAAAAGIHDADGLEFPLVTSAQHAGETDRLGAPWPTAPAVEVPVEPAAPSLDEVIARRGSQRRMDPDRGLPAATLQQAMAVAMRGIDVDHWVAVHDVDGLPSGLYRWPELVTPVREVNAELLRAETYRLCLDQALGRDAAFVVIATTDVGTLSDREYRAAQLAAGLVEGRLHLAAYALGAGATGMTFADSELPGMVGQAADGLIFTCVGVPDNTAKVGGAPGAPVEVRAVEPRE